MDFDALEAISARTGGQFFEATDENSLATVYARIDELAVADVKTSEWRPRQSLVQWPAGAALVLSLVSYALLLLGSRRRRAIA